jgi:hypothetical protein
VPRIVDRRMVLGPEERALFSCALLRTLKAVSDVDSLYVPVDLSEGMRKSLSSNGVYVVNIPFASVCSPSSRASHPSLLCCCLMFPAVNQQSPPEEKIALFRSLFRGRDDVYPRRFESRKTGKSGYSPACANEWVRGLCDRRATKCMDCPSRRFPPPTAATGARTLCFRRTGTSCSGSWPKTSASISMMFSTLLFAPRLTGGEPWLDVYITSDSHFGSCRHGRQAEARKEEARRSPRLSLYLTMTIW